MTALPPIALTLTALFLAAAEVFVMRMLGRRLPTHRVRLRRPVLIFVIVGWILVALTLTQGIVLAVGGTWPEVAQNGYTVTAVAILACGIWISRVLRTINDVPAEDSE
jgi:protein-S-isoprenylcysteine O-methyltransferase Ste14